MMFIQCLALIWFVLHVIFPSYQIHRSKRVFPNGKLIYWNFIRLFGNTFSVRIDLQMNFFLTRKTVGLIYSISSEVKCSIIECTSSVCLSIWGLWKEEKWLNQYKYTPKDVYIHLRAFIILHIFGFSFWRTVVAVADVRDIHIFEWYFDILFLFALEFIYYV